MGQHKTNFNGLFHRETDATGPNDYSFNVHHEDNEVDDTETIAPSDMTAIGAQLSSSRTGAFDAAVDNAWTQWAGLTGAEKDNVHEALWRLKQRLNGNTP